MPQEIYDQLSELEVSGRILNFVSFIISKKNLFFSSLNDRCRISEVGVPQGGVLSPFFCLSLLNRGRDLLIFSERCLGLHEPCFPSGDLQGPSPCLFGLGLTTVYRGLKFPLRNLRPYSEFCDERYFGVYEYYPPN